MPISKHFATWASDILQFLTETMKAPKTRGNVTLRQLRISVDASNCGGNLSIFLENEQIFSVPVCLPTQMIAQSDKPELEYSSTAAERYILLTLGIQTALKFIKKKFPREQFQLQIFSDSLPVVYQTTGAPIKSMAVTNDLAQIFEALKNSGMPFAINWHRRNQLEATLADENTRIFFPKLHAPYFRKLKLLTKSAPLYNINLIELFLDPENYLSCLKQQILFIPLNLSTKLYSEI